MRYLGIFPTEEKLKDVILPEVFKYKIEINKKIFFYFNFYNLIFILI